MLQASDLTKAYDGAPLFDGLSFVLGDGERAGHRYGRPGTPAAHPRHRTPEPARSRLAGRRSCAVAAYFTAEEGSARRARREVRLPLRRSPTRA